MTAQNDEVNPRHATFHYAQDGGSVQTLLTVYTRALD